MAWHKLEVARRQGLLLSVEAEVDLMMGRPEDFRIEYLASL